MAFFQKSMGMNPTQANSMLGTYGAHGPGGDTQKEQLVQMYIPEYVPLDHDVMDAIENYYDREPLIAAANNILSFQNLGGGFEVFFAGTKMLDDNIYHHKKPLERLLEEARSYRDKFGFVIVQDTNAHMDNVVRELRGDPLQDADDKFDLSKLDVTAFTRDLFGADGIANEARGNGNFDLLDTLTQEASLHMHRVTNALGLPDVRADLLGDVGRGTQTSTNNVETTFRSSPPDTAAGAPLRRERVDITYDQRDTTLREPNAVARISSVPEPAAAQRPRKKTTERRTFEDVFSSLGAIKVVNWRDGRLFLEINRLTCERRIVFCRRNADYEKASEKGELQAEYDARRLPTMLKIDESAKVVVFPTRMPSDDGEINSQIPELIKLRAFVTMAERRLAEANDTNVKPTVFLSLDNRVSADTLQDFTEPQRFEGANGRSVSRAEQEREDAVKQFKLEMAVEYMNGKRRSELAAAIARGMEQPTLENADGTASYAEKGGERIFALPAGYTVGQVVRGTTIDDVNSRRFTHHTAVASVKGFSLVALLGSSEGAGGSNRSSGNVTSSAQAISSDLMRSTIVKDRESLAWCGAEIYDACFRWYDNDTFMRILASARMGGNRVKRRSDRVLRQLVERCQLVTEAAEQVRLQQEIVDIEGYVAGLVSNFSNIEQRIREVTSMESRLTIEFTKTLFISYDELARARQINAISALEHANMMRSHIALPPLTSEEFERNKREALEDAREQAAVSAKPPPGGEGVGAKRPAADRESSKKPKTE